MVVHIFSEITMTGKKEKNKHGKTRETTGKQRKTKENRGNMVKQRKNMENQGKI